jgi:hypothetical protein
MPGNPTYAQLGFEAIEAGTNALLAISIASRRDGVDRTGFYAGAALAYIGFVADGVEVFRGNADDGSGNPYLASLGYIVSTNHVRVGNSPGVYAPVAGDFRFNAGTFQGYDGATWNTFAIGIGTPVYWLRDAINEKWYTDNLVGPTTIADLGIGVLDIQATRTLAQHFVQTAGSVGVGQQIRIYDYIPGGATATVPGNVALGYGLEVPSGYDTSGTPNVVVGSGIQVIAGADASAVFGRNLIVDSGAPDPTARAVVLGADLSTLAGVATARNVAVGLGTAFTGTDFLALASDAGPVNALNSIYIGLGGAGATDMQDAILLGSSLNNAAINGYFGIGIGFEVSYALRGTAIGYQAAANAADSMAIGYAAVANNTASVAFGRGASTTAANQLRVGSDSYPLNASVVGRGSFGDGTTSASYLFPVLAARHLLAPLAAGTDPASTRSAFQADFVLANTIGLYTVDDVAVARIAHDVQSSGLGSFSFDNFSLLEIASGIVAGPRTGGSAHGIWVRDSLDLGADRAYGLRVDPITGGVLGNWAAWFGGAIHVGDRAAPGDELQDGDIWHAAGAGLRFRSTGTTYEWPTTDGTAGQVLSTSGTGSLSWVAGGGGGGGEASEIITQPGHGFTVADIGVPLRFNGTLWVVAQADNIANAESPGLLGAINSINAFTIIYLGPIDNLPFVAIPGETYFMDDAVAGPLTLTAPTAPGSVNKPMLLATDVDKGVVLQYRGFQVPVTAVSVASGTTYLANYNNVSPFLFFEVPLGQTLTSIDVEVLQVWDGAGAAIEIGTLGTPDEFYQADETELTSLVTFAKGFSELGPVDIYLTITPGLGASTGQIRIQVTTTPTGT